MLGEVMLVLATMLDQAAALAHANEAGTSEAKYRAHLAWSIALHRRSEGEVPVFDEQVLARFGHAEVLLAPQRTLQARGDLVTMYALAGQAALTCSEWIACGQWLGKAEQVARAAGLAPPLATVLMQHGLALLQLGRSRGTAYYDQAAAKLDESRSLYERIDLPAFTWRAIFHRAL